MNPSPPSLVPRRLTGSMLIALVLAGCGGSGSSGGPPPDPEPQPSACRASPGAVADARPANPGALIDQQWHLRNTGQSGGSPNEDLRAFDAWAWLRSMGREPGAGVRVAVIDGAVDLQHPALQTRRVAGGSWNYRTSTPTEPLPCEPTDTGHGTAVAGIIAADGSAGSGAGVAPGAALVAFNALSTRSDADIAEALTRDLPLNNLFHNSWGSTDDGQLKRVGPSFAAAIDRGLREGRGGLGALYVFPAGNGGCIRTDGSNICTPDADRSTYDGYLNHRGVIVACAVDHNGERPIWAESGSNLLVCGPSGPPRSVVATAGNGEIVTTHLEGLWRRDFTGASASAPMVSGVIALMLSANPRLSARDVRIILARSARRNDPNHPDWRPGAAGGLAFHPAYGFGVAQALDAVKLASSWTSVGTESNQLTCTASALAQGVGFPIAIPDGVGISIRLEMNIEAASCAIRRIEHVELRLEAPHAYGADLRLELTSPSGTSSLLADQREVDRDRICRTPQGTAIDCPAYDATWPMATVRHLDEPAIGLWQLRIEDRLSGRTGQVDNWQLRIWGR